MSLEPQLIEGALAVDDRGELASINGLDLGSVKRFYVVRNYRPRFVRAWHTHRQEGKYVSVLNGAALVCCVQIDDWTHPSTEVPVHRYVLSAHRPSVLVIPPGFANGSMSLTSDAMLLYLSTHSFEDARDDDVRYPARYWDPWSVEER